MRLKYKVRAIYRLRNTVDTLMYTRELKKVGVEVFFIEDNIWTMNDDDGELKLTIIATLAQNESKKISVRAKAGQHISFLNGVMYGNGNILGYERVGKELVVNEKQAEVVRTIFQLYLNGQGMTKICRELERRGYVSSTGLTKWKPGTISGILNNPFYCGKIVYRKSYVQDYLSHKIVTNRGEVEQVVVEGRHQPLISVDTFEKAQSILKSKTSHQLNIGKGQKPSEDVWVRKMRCTCGRTFARRMWHRKKNDGTGQITYRCRSQMETGSIVTRQNNGLSIDGVCDTPWVQHWKLEVMLYALFKNLWEYREEIIQNAMVALKETLLSEPVENEEININKQLSGYEKQLDNLLDLYLDGIITKEKYLMKKEKIEIERKKLQNKEKCDNIISENKIVSRIGTISSLYEECFSEQGHQIPDEIIDVFVQKVIVHKDYFEWFINCNEVPTKFRVIGNKKKYVLEHDTSPPLKSCTVEQSSSGSAEQQIITVLKKNRNTYFRGTGAIPVPLWLFAE